MFRDLVHALARVSARALQEERAVPAHPRPQGTAVSARQSAKAPSQPQWRLRKLVLVRNVETGVGLSAVFRTCSEEPKGHVRVVGTLDRPSSDAETSRVTNRCWLAGQVGAYSIHGQADVNKYKENQARAPASEKKKNWTISFFSFQKKKKNRTGFFFSIKM